MSTTNRSSIRGGLIEHFAKIAQSIDPTLHARLARIFWYTIEFGLIQEAPGLRCYGAGILSSIEETVYALESDIPHRVKMDPLEALRTPYRIDVVQPVYFIIESFEALYQLKEQDLVALLHLSKELGSYEPKYAPKTPDKHARRSQ